MRGLQTRRRRPVSFFGMGALEIIVIALLAFILLGPERMIDAARTLGRLTREGRRMASEIPRVVMEDDNIDIVGRGFDDDEPKAARDGKRQAADSEASAPPDDERTDAPDDDGPVAFSRRDSPPPPRRAPRDDEEREPR